MNPESLLSQLAPLRPPDPVGWWPLALGWWLLLGLISAALVVVGVAIWRRYRRNAYRRSALQALTSLKQNPETSVIVLNRLLKATVRSGFGAQPATLSGSAWTAFLSDRCSRIDPQDLSPLADCYRANTPLADERLITAVTLWIRNHEPANV